MKKLFIAILALGILALAACGAPEAVYRKIAAEEACQMMQETDGYILLDVRTDEEFAEKHIGGAILIPAYEIGNRAAAELPDKNALILLYCRSGGRSEIAAQELVAMGYTNVYDFGGIIDWPYDTVCKSTDATNGAK